jgi:alpha-beta hydrolase superfamily lysophospholipase
MRQGGCEPCDAQKGTGLLGFDLICEHESWKHSDAEYWPASERGGGAQTRVFFSQGVKPTVPLGEKRAAVVLCHGYTGCGTSILRTIPRVLNEAGYAVLDFDYKGWATASGR